MDWKLELVAVPVSDVDRAKRFYTEQVGFNADQDHQVGDNLRFVQLTPPARPARSPWAPASRTPSPAR
jgi:catechol 2,3-dioxygenase-like lactoylglutathione lyase family enzyme